MTDTDDPSPIEPERRSPAPLEPTIAQAPPPPAIPAPPSTIAPPPPPPPAATKTQTSAYAPTVNVNVSGAGPLPPKSLLAAYLLWFFLGVIGIHHFYLGKTGRAIGYIFTGAWLTVGLWIDLFTLPSQVRTINARRAVGIK